MKKRKNDDKDDKMVKTKNTVNGAKEQGKKQVKLNKNYEK